MINLGYAGRYYFINATDKIVRITLRYVRLFVSHARARADL